MRISSYQKNVKENSVPSNDPVRGLDNTSNSVFIQLSNLLLPEETPLRDIVAGIKSILLAEYCELQYYKGNDLRAYTTEPPVSSSHTPSDFYYKTVALPLVTTTQLCGNLSIVFQQNFVVDMVLLETVARFLALYLSRHMLIEDISSHRHYQHKQLFDALRSGKENIGSSILDASAVYSFTMIKLVEYDMLSYTSLKEAIGSFLTKNECLFYEEEGIFYCLFPQSSHHSTIENIYIDILAFELECIQVTFANTLLYVGIGEFGTLVGLERTLHESYEQAESSLVLIAKKKTLTTIVTWNQVEDLAYLLPQFTQKTIRSKYDRFIDHLLLEDKQLKHEPTHMQVLQAYVSQGARVNDTYDQFPQSNRTIQTRLNHINKIAAKHGIERIQKSVINIGIALHNYSHRI